MHQSRRHVSEHVDGDDLDGLGCSRVVVVVRFGEQYRQWNAAFDAGYAAALGTPLITLHPPEHDHAHEEVDHAALAVAREPEQVVEARMRDA